MTLFVFLFVLFQVSRQVPENINDLERVLYYPTYTSQPVLPSKHNLYVKCSWPYFYRPQVYIYCCTAWSLSKLIGGIVCLNRERQSVWNKKQCWLLALYFWSVLNKCVCHNTLSLHHILSKAGNKCIFFFHSASSVDGKKKSTSILLLMLWALWENLSCSSIVCHSSCWSSSSSTWRCDSATCPV